MASVQAEGKRNANMDLLRILSMMMVTMLHALGKSDLLLFMGRDLPVNGWIAWILEGLSICAVNVFMLLSGYFLIKSTFRWRRFWELIFQTFFYVLGSFLIFLLLGKISRGALSVYDWLQYLFPIHMETYWFITAYVIIYLLLPLLTSGVMAMTEKQLRYVILSLIVFECILKSVLPVKLAIDTQGYSFFWYMIVFLLGAYFRLYGFRVIRTAAGGRVLYFAGAFLAVAEIFLLSQMNLHTGRLKEMLHVSMDYNHIFVLLSAIGLFAAFLHAKPVGEKAGRLILRISPYCLGVYLLQENLPMRYEWQNWFGLHGAMEEGVLLFLLRTVGAVLVMFVLGVTADALRAFLFRGVGKLFGGKDVSR